MRKMKRLFNFRVCILLAVVMIFGNIIPTLAASPLKTQGIESVPVNEAASPAAVMASPAAITTSPAAVTTSPAAITASPATVTTSPAAVTTSPAAITASPAAVTASPAAATATSIVKERDYRVYYYVLNVGLAQPQEVTGHDKKNYSQGLFGTLKELKVVGNEALVKENLGTIPDYTGLLGKGQYIKWYVIKWYAADGWHVDGIIMNGPEPTATVSPSPTPTVSPSPTPTVSPSPTPTPTPPASPTPTPPASPTPTPPASPTPTPTATPEISSPVIIDSPSVPAAPVTTVAPTASPTASPTAAPEVTVGDNDTPQAPGSSEADNDNTVDIIDNTTPQADAGLPKTGTTPVEVYYILGFALMISGTVTLLSRKNHKKPE